MNNLFVYGTLMHGHSRNQVLKNFKFKKAVLNGYKRYWPKKLGFPFISPSPPHSVEGEIYFDIDKDTIHIIDQIEGEGTLYHRIEVKIKLIDNGEEFTAWTYVAGDQLVSQYV